MYRAEPYCQHPGQLETRALVKVGGCVMGEGRGTCVQRTSETPDAPGVAEGTVSTVNIEGSG